MQSDKELRPVVSAPALRQAFETIAKDRWSSRLDAVMKSRKIQTTQLATLADTTPQTVDKIRRGQIVPREYLRFALAMALGCEVDDIFPMPTRAELMLRSTQLAAA